MYNKIFTKILDSSVWLEPTPTRIVWVTFLAAMDEHGFCPFAAVGNVAARARVTLDEAQAALATLESPDPDSADPEFEGRRIERAGGGWLVLNADKYRRLVTRAVQQEQTRERVRRHRERRNASALQVTSTVTRHDRVTPSEADTEADQDQNIRSTPREKPRRPAHSRSLTVPDGFNDFWDAYPRKVAKPTAMRAWTRQQPPLEAVLDAIRRTAWSPEIAFVPHPATWLNARRWEDGSSASTDTPSANGLPLADPHEHWADECRRLGHLPPCPHRHAHWIVMQRHAHA